MSDITVTGPGGSTLKYEDRGTDHHEENLAASGHANVVRATIDNTATTYADGDAIGGSVTLTNALRWNDGTAWIVSASLVDIDSVEAAIRISFFSEAFTASTDDAAFDPTDGDLQDYWLGDIIFYAGDYETHNDNSTATITDTINCLPLLLEGSAGNQNIYCQTSNVSGASKTFGSANALKLILGLEQY